jgi:hypothetical protein
MIELGEWHLLAVFIVGVVGAIIFSELGRLLVKRRRVGIGAHSQWRCHASMLGAMLS